jgi:murein DD-endopeptidase MepM/ murein hydrolase activator NlpD
MRLAAASALFIVAALCAGDAGARAATAQGDRSPVRGMVFLAPEVGDSTSVGEVLDFVDSCHIDFVVFDFAWITGTWQRTRIEALRDACQRLKKKGVRVAVMYRPRVLSPKEAEVHCAVDKDGKVAANHNHLCFAHDDSQAWGAQWGSRILKEIPSLDTIILYNLLGTCECPQCRSGKAAATVTAFLKRCRSEWGRIRPGVKIGHVGMGDEYADAVDFLCPFVGVNREKPGDADDAPLAFPQDKLERIRAAHAKQWMAPLLKVCWQSQTNNSTADVVQTLQSCQENKTGFLVWYYEWILHPDDGRYDPKPIVAALGGNWRRLSKYCRSRPPSKAPQKPSQVSAADVAKAIAKFRANVNDSGDLSAAGKAAAAGLVAILRDRTLSSQHRYMAANMLGDIKSRECVQPLLQALGDGDFNVRRCAAVALGKIGDRSVAPALQRLAKADPFVWKDPQTGKLRYLVREDAQKALKMLTECTSNVEDVELHKEREVFLKDASVCSKLKLPFKPRRLPWPFPGEFADQNIWNNYQQPTDDYIHGGLDFLLPAGTEVRAVEDGYVGAISPRNFPGWKTHSSFIVATKKGGTEGWSYTHLNPETYAFKEGDRVRQGDVIGKLADFYVGSNKGADHLHLNYMRFRKRPDGVIEFGETLADPLLFFDNRDSQPPKILGPLRFVRKETLDEFPKEDGQAVVSGAVEIIAAVSRQTRGNWMAAVVTLEIEGESAKPWRKLVLDQRGAIFNNGPALARTLYLTGRDGDKWKAGVPAIGGTFFLRATSTDGDGAIEPSDKLQAWNTAEKGPNGKPRFPDGLYTVTLRVWNLREAQDTRTETVRVVNKR